MLLLLRAAAAANEEEEEAAILAVAAAEEVVVVQVVEMAEMAAGRISVMHKMAVMLQGTVLLQFLVQIIAMVALLFKLMQKAGSETLFRVAQENPVL